MIFKNDLGTFGSPDPFKQSYATNMILLFALGFLAFFATLLMAISVMGLKLSNQWADELVNSATIRIATDEDNREKAIERALQITKSTKSIQATRILSEDERKALLLQWIGEDIPDTVPIPDLITLEIDDSAEFDANAFKFEIEGTIEGAYFENHSQWRHPLQSAAGAIRSLSLFALFGVIFAMICLVSLAARTVLFANRSEIKLLQLLGAYNRRIERGFVNRFVRLAFTGSIWGTIFAMITLFLLPSFSQDGAFLSKLRLTVFDYIILFSIPFLLVFLARLATKHAFRALIETN